jgi:RNA polymerase sigma-70 factor (ECF subfamily)
MTRASGSQTNATLLGRLRREPTDQEAWAQFVDHYGPRIYGWCRAWGLQDADAQDVTQTVLVRLAEKMRGFTYDPSRSFRGWLKTLAHHAWSDFLEGRRRRGTGGDTGAPGRLEAVEAPADLAQRLEEAFDRELLDVAAGRVRQRVRPRTWDAFHLTALEGLSGAEAARRLGMQVAHVFVAKSEVRRMLADEIRRLEQDGPA